MLCGVTATLGSNPSATATAARPHWGRAVLLCLGGVPCGCVAPRVFRAPEAPAAREARRPHCVRRRASKPAHALRSLRRPPHQWGWVADVCLCVVSKPGRASPPPTGTAADPSGALHTSGAWCVDGWLGASARCPARPHRRPPISHVIPLRLVQTLNLHRWNCNVCGVSRKMTTINYVRNLGGGGVVAARGCRRQARGLFEAAPPGI